MERLIGLLKVKVLRGVNLVSRDARSSDAYVVVSNGSQKVKTGVKKDSVNPEWNDDLTLSVNDPEQTIKLEVFDKDTFTSDDKMGEAEFNIKPLAECASKNFSGIPNGTVLKSLSPSTESCLASESHITLKDGSACQELVLKLKNVEHGEVELQLQWINIPHVADMSFQSS